MIFSDGIVMRNWYFGTSGLVLPVPNKSFYPEEYKSGSRLHYYASLFTSIEINSTFYRLPRAATVANWVADVPPDFQLTIKVPKDVSHAEDMQFNRNALKDFLRIVEAANSRKGCLLLQFPAKMEPDVPKLRSIVTSLSKSGWPIALESRNDLWYTKRISDLLNRYNVIRVIHDWWNYHIPLESTGDTVYIRLHGPERSYRGKYTDAVLEQYAHFIKQCLTDNKTVYTYFNNTLGNVSGDLQALIDKVHIK